MQTFLTVFCLALMALSAAAVILFRSMLKAAISLAVTSALLAIVLFLLGAHWAALFELSVCAGLITVVFVSAISITTPDRRDTAHTLEHRRNFAQLPYMLLFAGLALLAVLLLSDFRIEWAAADTLNATFADFKQVFWNERQVDIVAQLALILAGAFAVVVLFKERGKNDEQ